VATVPVTKPLKRNGLNKRDKDPVKFRMLYQPLTKVDPLSGKDKQCVKSAQFGSLDRVSLGGFRASQLQVVDVHSWFVFGIRWN